MQEKSLIAATWHPIYSNSIKSSSELSPRPLDYLHDHLHFKIVLTTNELHQYIDYLHSARVDAESKLARLQTDFDSLSMEYERLKLVLLLRACMNKSEKLR
jgi:hypothetical protein